MEKQKVIFFDRDGTLIENKHYLNDYKQIIYLPQVFDSLKTLRDEGYKFVIVTNQSGMPRGIVTPEQISEIHDCIKKDFAAHGVEFLDFYYAPFLPTSNHPLRKPNPGMLLEAEQQYHIDLKNSWMIGDRMSDVEAGHRAGCRAILLGDDDSPVSSEYRVPEAHVKSFGDVVRVVLGAGG